MICSPSVKSVVSSAVAKPAKVFPFAASQRVPLYCYGDSTMANGGIGYNSATASYDYAFQDENNRGFPAYMELYSNGRVVFDVRNNFGYGGDTTADTVAILTGGTPSNSGTLPRKTVPTAGTGGAAYLEIGTNNLGSANISYSASIADYQTIFTQLKLRHNFIFVRTIKPRAPLAADKRERQYQLNAWLRAVCAADPLMYFIDGCSVITADNGDPIPMTFLDGLHPSGRGTALAATQAWFYEGLGSFVGRRAFPVAANNNIANPTLVLGSGTSFSKPSGFTGDVPQDWRVTAKVWEFPYVTLTDPFVTNGTTTVTVNQTGHGYVYDAVNDLYPRVLFRDAVAVGGVVIDGMYTIVGIPNANQYTITIPTAATAATGGGTVRAYNPAAYNDTGLTAWRDAVWTGSYDSDGVYTITGTIASASTDGYENLDFIQNISSVTGNGDTLQLQAEARTVSAVNCRGTAARIASATASTSENSAEAIGVYGSSYWHTTDVMGTMQDFGLFETGYYTTSSTSDTSTARFTIALQCYKGQSSSVTVKLKRMQMNRTPAPATVEMQRAQLTIASGQTAPASAATLTTTNPAKCMVLSYGTTTVNGSNVPTLDNAYTYRDFHTTIALTSTSITNQRNSATTSTTNIAYFYDVVRADTIIDATYLQTAQLTTTQGVGADFEITLTTAVDPTRSFIIVQNEVCNRAGSATASVSDIAAWIKDGDGTKAVVRLSSLAGSGTRNIILHVVQLKTGVVKNLTRFTIDIATGATSNTYSLSSLNSGAGVTDANTMIIEGGVLQGGTSSNTFNVNMVALSRSGNTITAARGASSATLSLTQYGYAIEFNAGYVNVQNLSVTMTSTSHTVTSSSYTAARTFMMISGASSAAANASNESDVRFYAQFGNGSGGNLTTQQTFTRTGSANNLTVPYQVVSVL